MLTHQLIPHDDYENRDSFVPIDAIALGHSIRLRGRLERMTIIVVEGVVQKENEFHAQPQHVQATAQLMKGVGSQPSSEQRSQVLGTQVDLDGGAGLQGKSEVANGSDPTAHRALVLLGAHGQRRR